VIIHTHNPSFSKGRNKRITSLRPACAKLEALCPKQNINKMAGGMTQAEEHLPSMCKALGSIPSNAKMNKQTKYPNKQKRHGAIHGWINGGRG
jgi:hypothetical protein